MKLKLKKVKTNKKKKVYCVVCKVDKGSARRYGMYECLYSKKHIWKY